MEEANFPSDAGGISPAMQLLLLTARPQAWESRAAVLQALAGLVDWDEFAALAALHGVHPLCFGALLANDGLSIPAARQASFDQTIRGAVRQNLAFTAELLRLTDYLESRGIVSIAYKGPALALQAYGDIGMREFGDLDLLVRHRDLPALSELMREHGYVGAAAAAPDGKRGPERIPGQYSFTRPQGSMLIEFHTERTLRYYPTPPDLAAIARRAVEIRVNSRKLMTLSPEDAVTILSVHGCKHLWCRLLWVADIAWLIGSPSRFDWDLAMRISCDLGARRMTLAGVGLAADVLALEIPGDVHTMIRSNSAVRQLIAESRRELLAYGSSAAGAYQRALFRVRSIEGFTHGLRYLYRLSTSPAEDDWRQADGSAAALTRPFRLLRKYGLTGRKK